MTQPIYEHDCDACIFLGIEDEYDMYICQPRAEMPIANILARFGTHGEYSSFPVTMLNCCNGILNKVARAAFKQGHLVLEDLPDDMQVEELKWELAYYHAIEEDIARTWKASTLKRMHELIRKV